MDIDLLRRFL